MSLWRCDPFVFGVKCPQAGVPGGAPWPEDGPGFAAGDAGLQFATVDSRPITKTVECNAEVAYDASRYAEIAAQVPGIVAEVHKDLGETIRPGEPLVTITSTHLGDLWVADAMAY